MPQFLPSVNEIILHPRMIGDILHQGTGVVKRACRILKIRKRIPCAISIKNTETEHRHITHPVILQIRETFKPATFCDYVCRWGNNKSPFTYSERLYRIKIFGRQRVQISLLPATNSDRLRGSDKLSQQAVNKSVIKTYGQKWMTLNLRLNGEFGWFFVIIFTNTSARNTVNF